jgi:hypothetical protein
MLKNIDIKKLIMAEEENKNSEKNMQFLRSRIKQARLIANTLNN